MGIGGYYARKFILTEAQNVDLCDKNLMQIPLVISTVKYPEGHLPTLLRLMDFKGNDSDTSEWITKHLC